MVCSVSFFGCAPISLLYFTPISLFCRLPHSSIGARNAKTAFLKTGVGGCPHVRFKTVLPTFRQRSVLNNLRKRRTLKVQLTYEGL